MLVCYILFPREKFVVGISPVARFDLILPRYLNKVSGTLRLRESLKQITSRENGENEAFDYAPTVGDVAL